MKGVALWLAIAIGLLVLLGAGLGIFFTVLWNKMQTSGADRIQERFPAEQIVLSEATANFLGLESRGSWQMRGNGVLVLTSDELWFSRFVKREDITIPTQMIQDVRLVDSHLGKRVIGRTFIYVQFQTDSGLDAVAWLVKSPERWQEAIAPLINGATSTH